MSSELFPAGAVLVVGGSGGIGQAVCREFARAGSDVALTYHGRQGVAENLAAEIRAMGRRATAHRLTIGDPESVEAVVAEAAREHGRLHTIVVGAGTLPKQVPLSQLTREQWQTVVDQDVHGFFNVLQATLARLKAWGGGSYVHIGSAGHLRWPDRDGLSVVPKAAIEALVTGVAREEGRFNVRANSVLVGVVEAGQFLELMQQGAFDERWIEAAHRNFAIKRWGKPEEVGYAVVFLASNRAAYVTGQRIAVSGGYGI